MNNLNLLSANELRKKCPIKWHDRIPDYGISLGVADIDFSGPEGVVDFIKSNLDESFAYYQDHSGLNGAITKITDYLKNIGIKADKQNIQVTPGTMMGIYAAMKYASRRDGKIVYIGPLYEPIHRHGKDNNNEIDWVGIDYKNSTINEEDIKNTVNNNTKMIAINNPSNPIGYSYTKNTLELIRDLAIDYDLTVFSDELYAPLVFEKNFVAAPSINGIEDRIIALYGFSKAYGLAGYRSGFMYLGDNLAEEVKYIIESQMVSPSPISSLIAEYALGDKRAQKWVSDFRKYMRTTTIFASKYLRDNGIPCHTPDSTFFVFPDLGIDDVKFAEDLLIKKAVQVVPGSYFGPMAAGHVRINCATSVDRLKEGLDRLIELWKEYK